jgi:ABC-type dipeptide/oligopeptide/nickel transport system permease subunit
MTEHRTTEPPAADPAPPDAAVHEAAGDLGTGAAGTAVAAVSRRGRVWGSFRRNRAAMTGLVIIAVFLLLALLAPVAAPYDPNAQSLTSRLQTPSAQHWFGTDNLGRDILSRVVYGARISMLIGVLAVGIGLLVGVPLGLLSGYFGRWVDIVIQRVTDVMLAFPTILLALTLVAALGIGVRNVIIATGISVIPHFIRIVRGSALSLRVQGYVEAARAENAPDLYILGRHILPNAMAPLIVQATLSIGGTILIAAGLGFLGLGVQAPTAEWGAMLGEGRQYIFNAAYIATFPGLAIVLVVLAFNLVGDGLRDALDPRMQTF